MHAWIAWVGVLSDNDSKVLLALIAAGGSIATTYLQVKDRRERRAHYKQQQHAIESGGLVAMVPEHIVRDVENAKGQ